MKNRKLTYGLLVVVMALWGLIFYRVFDSVAVGDEKIKTAPAIISGKITATDPIPGNFTLLLDYRDPFLGTLKPVKKVNDEYIPEEPSPAEFMDWSFIRYLGVIINPKTSKKVSLLNINGQDHMMEEGMSIEGIKLIRNYKDSVKISFNGTQTFIKQ